MGKYHRLKQVFQLIQDDHLGSFLRRMDTYLFGKARAGPQTGVFLTGSKADMAVAAGCVWKKFMSRFVLLPDDARYADKNANGQSQGDSYNPFTDHHISF